jgi:hypothetical protein
MTAQGESGTVCDWDRRPPPVTLIVIDGSDV